MQLNAKNQESMGKERSTMGKFETLGTNMDERTGRNNWTSLTRHGYLKYRPVFYFRSSPEFGTQWSKDRIMNWLSMFKYNQMKVESW